VVVAAKDTLTSTEVAIKKIKGAFDNVTDGKRILREVRILRYLRHRNVSHVIDIMRPPKGSSEEFDDVYIVLDLMDTDLHRVIYSTQKLSDQHVQFLMFQLLSAVDYMQSKNVIHRDLKPSNVLVNAACELRVCDFGLARGLDAESAGGGDEAVTIYVVTRWYRAPELLLSCRTYTGAIDTWSVGCIFAELLGRKPLFPGEDYLHQLGLICDLLGSPKEDDLDFVSEGSAARFLREMDPKPRVAWRAVPQLAESSEQALDLLDNLLEFSPNKRFSAAQALDHPYLEIYAKQRAELLDERANEAATEPYFQDDVENEKMDKAALREAIMEEIRKFRGSFYD
jgi:serine/threonine protein kinase